jgi:predicted ATPase
MLEAAQTIVGRAAELDLLDDVLASLERVRRPRAIELDGEPGIGKTRLLTELSRAAVSRAA